MYWALEGLYAAWEKGRDEALLAGWEELVAEYAAMPYAEYLQTSHWRYLADLVKERDGNRCRLCNTGERLEAHHRTYEARRGEEQLEHLTTLCRRCHGGYHEHIERPEPVTPLRRFEPPI